MKSRFLRCVCLLLIAAMILPLWGCTPAEPVSYDGAALVSSLLAQVQFAESLENVGDATAALYFPDLPEGSKVQLYLGSGYYADEVALITLGQKQDAAAGKSSAQEHIAQLRAQFVSYIPEEVGKIDKAVIWEGGNYIIVCITADYANAKLILDHASDPNYKLPGSSASTGTTGTTQGTTGSTQGTTGSTQGTTGSTQGTTPSVPTGTTVPSQPSISTNPTTGGSNSDGYPALLSQSGTWYRYPDTYLIRVDNAAYEICGFNMDSVNNYVALVNKATQALKGQTTVYSIPIPTAFGVTLPDDIQAKYPGYVNQGDSTQTLFSLLSADVQKVNVYENMMPHRDEYLYFRTDHHWNGKGAYYAYEAFCDIKGITPYTMTQREEMRFDQFYGLHYTVSGKDNNLMPADTVYAYKPVSSGATMVFYDKNGKGTNWPIINDVTNYDKGGKYGTFAGGDNPLTVFTNPEVTDGSVCVVVKESFGNALMPLLVDHYSTIYEIDYRYWTGDLVEYTKQVGAEDLIFANNIQMIGTSLLVGKLGKIIP